MKRIFPAVLLILAAGAAHAQTVYKCTAKNGTPVFSTDPCGAGAEKIDVRPASGADPPPPQPPASAPPMDPLDARVDDACHRHAIEIGTAPSGSSNRMQRLEQQKALIEGQKQNMLHSNRSYDSISAQLANVNSQIDQAYAADQAEAQQRAAMSRQELAQCDRDRDMRAKQKAATR